MPPEPVGVYKPALASMPEQATMAKPRIAASGFNPECLSVVPPEYRIQHLPWDGSGLIENYDLTLLYVDGHTQYKDLAIQREKQVMSALKKGKSIVFLFSAITVARQHESLKPLLSLLDSFGMRAMSLTDGKRHLHAKRQEFKTFLDRYGLAFALFSGTADQLEPEYQVDDIALHGPNVVARSAIIGRGRLIMLPVHNVAMEQPALVKESLPTLISGVNNYIDRIGAEDDAWAREVFVFDAEKPLADKERELEQQLADTRKGREAFQKWKPLLSAKEYPLQNLIPAFLQEAFGLSAKQDEKFVEDFWIEDAEGKKIAIGEVTSTETSNVSFGTTGKIQSNRSQHGQPDNFQGILVVNTFTRKQSITEKDEPIPPNVRIVCSNTKVLVTRTLDLLRIYNLLLQGRLPLDTIRDAILKESGWLTVNEGKGELLVLKQ